MGNNENQLDGIAIIGMACNLPGASNIVEYWENLSSGLESISVFSEEELNNSLPGEIKQNPNYIKARGIIKDADMFDAKLFKINALEAKIMDPQQRKFLELAWHCLEDAGYCTDFSEDLIGVYAGMGNNTYFYNNVSRHPKEVEAIGEFQAMTLNERDYLATRTAYKLNLTGPAMSIYSSSSTSLVAVCNAYESLMAYQCDIALAGGVNIMTPQKVGYLLNEGNILSRDGCCRPFDSNASGTVPGNGAGIVALKRLDEALNDGDNIYAVLKGAAVNNDGAHKSKFTSPSISGQAEVIAAALASSEVDPETISYIETNGVGAIGEDSIEIEALTQVFKELTAKTNFCAIGSVKGNIGNLDAAAGIASLIKAVLSIKHAQIPPSLHFKNSAPKINLNQTPFFVNKKLNAWPQQKTPMRAGVSSFGIGGTNAHVVIEEAPEPYESSESKELCYLIPFSANSENVLENIRINLRDFIQNNTDVKIADISFTLCKGRKNLPYRQVLICKDRKEALKSLQDKNIEIAHHTRGSNVYNDIVLEEGSYSEYRASINEIGQAWVSGGEVDWDAICKNTNGKRISLPLYPFEKKRFWLDTKPFSITISEVGQKKKVNKQAGEFVEIEDAINGHPAIAKSIVVKKSKPQNKYLIVYYVTNFGQSITVTELRSYSIGKVSNYSIPLYFSELDSLPEMNSETIDAMSLPDPYFNAKVAVKGKRKPKTPAEKILIEVFQETLDIENIMSNDNFYDLGGNSLLSLQVIAIIKQKLGIEIDPNAILLDTIRQISVQYFNQINTPSKDVKEERIEDTHNVEFAYESQIVMNLHYFGNKKYNLLGVYYPPEMGKIKNKAVVLCYPVGHEYIRSHWAFRQLSNALSKLGFSVLRFDYYATGDSAGDTKDGSVDTWLKSIQLAIEELKEISNLDRVSLIGLRLGAALACMASKNNKDVDELLLWDPVINGSEYLDDLKSMHCRIFNVSKKENDDILEMLGFEYPVRVQNSIRQIDLIDELKSYKKKLKVFVSEEKEEYRLFEKRLCNTERILQLKVIEDSGNWDDIWLYSQALMIKNIVNKIAQALL